VKEAKHVDVKPLHHGRYGRTYRAQLRPIKWDPFLGAIASQEWIRTKDPSRLSWIEIRPHVALMNDRLTFQFENYKPSGISKDRLIELSLAKGPQFTNDWASGWKEARFKWCDVTRLEGVNDEKMDVKFDNYSDSIVPFFFIFWEDEVEDYKWMNQGIPESDPESLVLIEEEIARLSEEYLPDADFSCPDTVMWRPSSSNAYVGEGKTQPEWEVEFEDPNSDNVADTLMYLRGQAMKRPSEVRDIGSHTPASLRLHRKIMYPMQRACRRIPGCPYGRDQSFVRKVVETIGEKCNYYYMRDYTKSGMTMPRAVRSAIIRGFFRRSPELIDKYIKAFDYQVLLVNEKDNLVSKRPDTGTPLGMFVEGFTLLSYAAHNILIRSLPGHYRFIHSGTNDDVIVGSRIKEQVDDYITQDYYFQLDLGMNIKTTKTGSSYGRFIYCEEYWDFDHILSKEILTVNSILGAKFAINIVHAKELVNSVLMALPYFSNKVKHAVREVISCYDYEFSEDEHEWPFLLGGWWPTYEEGLDATIKYFNGDLLQSCAYWACREEPRKHTKLQDRPALAYARRMGLELIKEPPHQFKSVDLIPIFGTKQAIKDRFSLISRRPGEMVKYYRKKHWLRNKYFLDTFNNKKELPSVTFEWLLRHPKSVIVRGLEGVTYRPVDYYHNPKIGYYRPKPDIILTFLASMGYIKYGRQKKMSDSTKRVYNLGITEELYYTEPIGIAKEGLPLSMLTQMYPGLRKFNAETGLTISSMGPEDPPLEITTYWDLMRCDLVWLIRVNKLARDFNMELNRDNAGWWQQVLDDKFQVAEDWTIPEPVGIVVSEPISNFQEEIETTLRRLLDGVHINIQAKFVPRVVDELQPGCIKNSEGTILVPPEGYYYRADGCLFPLNEESITDFWDAEPESGDEEVAEGWDF
jgi:hypothetical protein